MEEQDDSLLDKQLILMHNIAGELASLYVSYINKQHGKIESYDYNKKVWENEYKSRISIMQDNPLIIPVLNSYNDFFKQEIKESSEVKRKFYYQ